MADSNAGTTDDVVRISGDSHVVEPTDLWVKNLPPKFTDRAPTFPKAVLGQHNYARPGGRDPVARLKDAAADGISAEIIFPTAGGTCWSTFYEEPFDLEFAEALTRVYNDWMIEYCQTDPDRLWGQAIISPWDIDHSIAELERVKNEGLKGVTIWTAPPDELPWTGDHYERFWSAAEELDMPISMHINNGFGAYKNIGASRLNTFDNMARQAFGNKVVAMKTLSEMILSNVFGRHPKLKLLMAEFDCGWVPFFLEDLDRKFGRNMGPNRPRTIELDRLPSEYYTDNVRGTFMQDSVTGKLLERWGVDNFVFSNDYPHNGGIWPHTDDTIALTLANLPKDTQKKVLGENIAKFYSQPLPTPVVRKPADDYDYSDVVWQRDWLKKEGEFTFDKPKMGFAL